MAPIKIHNRYSKLCFTYLEGNVVALLIIYWLFPVKLIPTYVKKSSPVNF